MNKLSSDFPGVVGFRELDLDEVDRGEILAALSRITTSARFRNAGRICDFLRYVVEETVEGRGSLVKAHTIAVDVFGRQNFDDESGEAVVRTSAHRLRLFLEGHFNDEGADDPYRIILPKGTYVPKFYAVLTQVQEKQEIDETARERQRAQVDNGQDVLRSDAPRPSPVWLKRGAQLAVLSLLLPAVTLAAYVWLSSPTDPHRPRIVVSTAPVDAGVSKQLSSELQLRIISNLVSFGSATILDRAHSTQDADEDGLFNLNVSLSVSEATVADWKLTDAVTGSILWTGQEKIRSTTYPAVDEAASSIASSVLGQEGAIAIWSGTSTGENDPRRCLSAAQMRSTLISDDSEKAQRCLTALTRDNPRDATAWALLSMTYFSLAAGSTPWTGGEDRKYFALQKSALAQAVRLNPDTFYTMLAQLFEAQARGDRDAFDDVSHRLLRQYGGYPGLRTQIAVKLAQAGRQAEALKLIESKVAMGADLNDVDNATLVLIRYFDGDYVAARPLVDRISDEETPLAVIMKVATYGQLGLDDQAQNSWSALLGNYPDYPQVMREVFKRVSIPDEKAEKIIQGVRKAGVLNDTSE